MDSPAYDVYKPKSSEIFLFEENKLKLFEMSDD